MYLEKKFKSFIFLALIVCCFAYAAVAGGAPAPGQFPVIQATSLNNAKLHLPQDFSGQLNLVIISFAREQQHQVDTWIPAAQQIQTAHANFSYYELPTMSSENLLYRWWFDTALRSNTAEKDLRSRILTAYVNKHKFRESLQIGSERKAVAVLIDRTGKVFWRASGNCTEQDKVSLLSALGANGV